ncbi:MAG TPA: peptidoglycan editing factor PgeF [Dermatophilaceae bacterium]|nr:peptidoglycan editing factor PgeF [Dermatophilaceae bacterium]
MFYWRSTVAPTVAGAPVVELAFTRRAGLEPPGASHGAASRFGGFNLGGHVGDDPRVVERNRVALARAVGVARERLVFMRQVHGTTVADVSGPWKAAPPECDGIVTATGNLALAVLVADCVPVLLHDSTAGVVGAVHAGRPGMTDRIVAAAVARMRELGAVDVAAVVGPSVCGRCYELPEELVAAAGRTSPVSVTRSWSGTPAVDVAAGVVDQLMTEGVAVQWVPGCTREDEDLYSYRRVRKTGRFAGVVVLRTGGES